MIKNKRGLIFLVVLAVSIIVASVGTTVYLAYTSPGKEVSDENLNKKISELETPTGFRITGEIGEDTYLIENEETGERQIMGIGLDGEYTILRSIGVDEDLAEVFGSNTEESATQTCGNAILEGDEPCDIGLLENCRPRTQGGNTYVVEKESFCRISREENLCECKYFQTCGDGNFEPKIEQCDESATDGNVCKNGEFCSLCECQKAPFCGDGSVNLLGEECDDGNKANGDGCDSQCSKEFCGDGISNLPGEECDDGNKANGDGCSSECKSEGGGGAGGGGGVPPVYTCGPIKGPVLTGQQFQCGGTCPPDYVCSVIPGNECKCITAEQSMAYVQAQCTNLNECSCGDGQPCFFNPETVECFCSEGSPQLATTTY